jgi:mannose-6-phosphate isomerase-like protein (cupin superfamily)
MSDAEILEARGLGLRVRRDDSGSDSEVGRAHVEATKGGNGGPAHIHLLQEERFIVHTGVLLVRRGHERLRVRAEEDVRIPPRVVHTFKTEAQSTFMVEFRAALRGWSSSATCLRSPPIGAATPVSAISLAFCAPTRTSSSTSPSFQYESRGHWQCRSPSSDLLPANPPEAEPTQTSYHRDYDFVGDGGAVSVQRNGSTEIVLDGSRIRCSG